MANEVETNEVVAEQTRPEPPKDENGNPIAPPEGFRPPMGGPHGGPHGGRPPEPPKDENGNPIAPPEGRPPFGDRPPMPESEGDVQAEAQVESQPETEAKTDAE